jgi:Domain of unknown function (DUF4124)
VIEVTALKHVSCCNTFPVNNLRLTRSRDLSRAIFEMDTMSAAAKRFLSVCLVASLAVSVAGAAEIYKWTDANGNVHYGDRPADDVNAERLSIQSRPTDPTRIAALAQARVEARSQAREQASAPAADEGPVSPAEQRRIAEERALKCNEYKNRLQSFLQSRRLYREDENGERIYLSEEETQAARSNVQSKVEEYCTP